MLLKRGFKMQWKFQKLCQDVIEVKQEEGESLHWKVPHKPLT